MPPDEADRLGIDEGRQLDELLRAAQEVPENYQDLTSQQGPVTGGGSDRTTKETRGAVTR